MGMPKTFSSYFIAKLFPEFEDVLSNPPKSVECKSKEENLWQMREHDLFDILFVSSMQQLFHLHSTIFLKTEISIISYKLVFQNRLVKLSNCSEIAIVPIKVLSRVIFPTSTDVTFLIWKHLVSFALSSRTLSPFHMHRGLLWLGTAVTLLLLLTWASLHLLLLVLFLSQSFFYPLSLSLYIFISLSLSLSLFFFTYLPLSLSFYLAYECWKNWSIKNCHRSVGWWAHMIPRKGLFSLQTGSNILDIFSAFLFYLFSVSFLLLVNHSYLLIPNPSEGTIFSKSIYLFCKTTKN